MADEILRRTLSWLGGAILNLPVPLLLATQVADPGAWDGIWLAILLWAIIGCVTVSWSARIAEVWIRGALWTAIVSACVIPHVIVGRATCMVWNLVSDGHLKPKLLEAIDGFVTANFVALVFTFIALWLGGGYRIWGVDATTPQADDYGDDPTPRPKPDGEAWRRAG